MTKGISEQREAGMSRSREAVWEGGHTPSRHPLHLDSPRQLPAAACRVPLQAGLVQSCTVSYTQASQHIS